MSPDKNDSQNKPKPEKKMGIDKGELGHPDPEMRGGQSPKKNFFSALRVSIWPTNKGGPGTFSGSATERFSGFKTGKGTTW